MFTLIDGKITYTGNDTPHERSGFLFYFKLNNKTKLIVLENKDGKLELATFGKCDFGLLKHDLDENELLVAKNKFIAKFNAIGEEPILAVASRKAMLETGGLIKGWPINPDPVEITTPPHTSWLSEEKEISTIISLYPYELSRDQFLTIENRTFSSFKRAITVDVVIEDGQVKLLLNEKNLLDDLSAWRDLDGTLLKNHADLIQKVFLKIGAIEKEPSLNLNTMWGCSTSFNAEQSSEPAAPAATPSPEQ